MSVGFLTVMCYPPHDKLVFFLNNFKTEKKRGAGERTTVDGCYNVSAKSHKCSPTCNVPVSCLNYDVSFINK